MANDKAAPSFPAGTYRGFAEWQSATFGWNAENTNEVVSVRLRVNDEKRPDVHGMSIVWFGNFANQQAIDISSQSLKAMGWDGKSPLGTPDGKNGCLAGLGGAEVEFSVKHDVYKGKTRAKVGFVNAIGAGFEFNEPLDAKALDKLNQRVRRHLGATDPRPARPATQPSAHQPQHRSYEVDPSKPATEPVRGPERPDPDVARARAIDAGAEEPPEEEDNGDDDVPF